LGISICSSALSSVNQPKLNAPSALQVGAPRSIIPPTSVIPKSFQTFGALGQPKIQEIEEESEYCCSCRLVWRLLDRWWMCIKLRSGCPRSCDAEW
jgi:hypothetical protein